MYRNTGLSCLFLIISCTVFSQATFKIQPGTNLKVSGGALITLNDINLENNGTLNLAAGDGTFKFTGAVNNSITGANSSTFDILEIAKTSGSKLSLGNTVNINSSINFTSGLIDLNSNNIIMSSAALLNGESETSRIIGPNGGYVEIVKTLNAPSSSNPGNLGAIISSSANLGSTSIRRGHVSQVNGNGVGNSILQYFDISIDVFDRAFCLCDSIPKSCFFFFKTKFL